MTPPKRRPAPKKAEPKKRGTDTTVTVKRDGWEVDCRGGTVQDMLDYTACLNDKDAYIVGSLKLAGDLIQEIRDPDGKTQGLDTSPSWLVHAVNEDHPFFQTAGRE